MLVDIVILFLLASPEKGSGWKTTKEFFPLFCAFNDFVMCLINLGSPEKECLYVDVGWTAVCQGVKTKFAPTKISLQN